MKKIVFGLIFFGNLAALFGLWWQNSGPLLTSGDTGSILIALGRIVGLIAMYFILVQLTLIGRIRIIEQEFGFDKLNRIHRLIGYSWAFFIPLHPILLTTGYALSSGTSIISQFVDFLTNWEDVFNALIGVTILIGVIIVSVSIIRKKLRYETWYFTHLLIYLAIFLIIGHQTQTGDVARGAYYVYWLTLNYVIFGLVLLYRFLRPIYLAWKHQFRIDRIVPETDTVSSVYLTGRKLNEYTFQPGQYTHITFLSKKMWYTHPFSFSAAPNGKDIRLSIKRSGDFTEHIQNLKPGTKAVLDGPFGVFTEKKAKTDKFLFLAAGIGITPIYSLIESLSPKKKDMILLYGTQSEHDTAFKHELATMNVRMHQMFSQEEVRGHETGRIDKEKITRLVPDIRTRDVYICGPEEMIKNTADIVESLGVPRAQIHFERFGY